MADYVEKEAKTVEVAIEEALSEMNIEKETPILKYWTREARGYLV